MQAPNRKVIQRFFALSSGKQIAIIIAILLALAAAAIAYQDQRDDVARQAATSAAAESAQQRYAESDSGKANAIYRDDTSHDRALANVRKFVVGTWTSARPNTIWRRIQVSPDGTFQEWAARPSDDDWGSPSPATQIQLTTGKYGNTGKRWFGFTAANDGAVFIVERDGSLHYRSTEGQSEDIVLQHMDAEPFSK